MIRKSPLDTPLPLSLIREGDPLETDITLTVRPLHKVDLTEENIRAYAELGATELVCDTSFGHETMKEALQEIEELAERVLPITREL